MVRRKHSLRQRKGQLQGPDPRELVWEWKLLAEAAIYPAFKQAAAAHPQLSHPSSFIHLVRALVFSSNSWLEFLQKVPIPRPRWRQLVLLREQLTVS